MKTYPTDCIDCDSGRYEPVVVDYTDVDQNGVQIVVPHVEILRCSACGAELIPTASSRQISEAVAKANDQLSPKELYELMEQFDLNQTQMAEIFGFGEKTYHRWLKGTQVVSRSMGFYLRAMAAHPEAFAYVRERAWRNPRPRRQRQSPQINRQTFPALAKRSQFVQQPRINPAQILAFCNH